MSEYGKEYFQGNKNELLKEIVQSPSDNLTLEPVL